MLTLCEKLPDCFAALLVGVRERVALVDGKDKAKEHLPIVWQVRPELYILPKSLILLDLSVHQMIDNTN